MVKMSKNFGESSDFLHFAICVSPRDKRTDMRDKKSGPYKIHRHIFCVGSL